jgi:hypothetical protein
LFYVHQTATTERIARQPIKQNGTRRRRSIIVRS